MRLSDWSSDVCSSERCVKVVVDGTGNPDYRYIEFRLKNIRSRESAVSANCHQRIDAMAFRLFVGCLTTFGSLKCVTSGGFQDSAATLNYIRYRFYSQGLYFSIDHPFVTAPVISEHRRVGHECVS